MAQPASAESRAAEWREVTRDRSRWSAAHQPEDSGSWAVRLIDVPQWEPFFFHHLVTNVPCVFGPALWGDAPISQSSHRGGWLCDDLTAVDVESIVQLFGADYMVPVTHCHNNAYSERRLAAAENTVPNTGATVVDNLDGLPCEVPFSEFAEHLVAMRNPERRARAQTLMYLKDWHMLRDLDRRDGLADPPYTCPQIFQDDYLNEFSLKHRADDYRFVYLGPQGTQTLLHTDVLGSYSWSHSVVGRKRWSFYSPEARGLLVDAQGRLPRDINNVDKGKHPRFAEAVATVIVQEPGQTVFVPSGWYHQVENIDECLSVNANWVNSCNIDRFISTVAEDHRMAKHEISDVREVMDGEWHAACHKMVKANCGFNYETVCELITVVCARISAELAPAALMARGAEAGQLSELRAATHRAHKMFELVQLESALTTVMTLWSSALDPDEVIPAQYERLAEVLAEQCVNLLTT